MERDTSEHDRPARDTGMVGSETEEPGPGRDAALTDPDPTAASSDQPRGTVAMSDEDPLRTRLGAHMEGAGLIGHDVAAAEGAAPDADMIGSEAQEPGPGRNVHLTDPDPVAASSDQPRGTVAMSKEDKVRTRLGAHVEGAGLIGHDVAAAEGAAIAEGAEGRPDPATYTGEEADVVRRPAYADRPEPGGGGYGEEPARIDRPGGERSIFGGPDERAAEPSRAAGVERNVHERGAEEAKRPRPSDDR